MTFQFDSDDSEIEESLRGKDPWPRQEMAPRPWVNHTAEQWSTHQVAFEARGFGVPGRVPSLAVIADLDRS